jgi:hypothetical protein
MCTRNRLFYYSVFLNVLIVAYVTDQRHAKITQPSDATSYAAENVVT